MSAEGTPKQDGDDLVALVIQVDPFPRSQAAGILDAIWNLVTGEHGVPVAATMVPAAELDRDDPDRPAELGRRAEDLDRQLADALHLITLVETWTIRPVIRHPQVDEARRELGQLLADARERANATGCGRDDDDPDPAVATVADQLAAAGLLRDEVMRLAYGVIGALHRGGHLAAACECPSLGHIPGRCQRALDGEATGG